MKHLILASALGVALICGPLMAQKDQKEATNATNTKDTVTNVTGCLAQGDAKNEYMIKDEAGKTYGLRGETGVDLKAHLGQKVAVTGTPMKSKEKVKAGQNEESEHLRVSNISVVSSTCTR